MDLDINCRKEKKNKNLKEINENFSEPKSMRLLNDILIYDTNPYFSDNAFIVKSINDILYLSYSNDNSLMFYDLVDNKKSIEIKKAHTTIIYEIKYT